MKIAVFGHSLFSLATGLRQNTDNHVQFFIDSGTIPVTLRDEPVLNDHAFVTQIEAITYQDLLKPRSAKLSEYLSKYDVAIVTDLGPIFAASIPMPFVIIPGGSDLTEYPFPYRSRSTRPRGRQDLLRLLIGKRLRPAIRSASDIWTTGPFSPWQLAADKLGLSLNNFLPRSVDTELFSPSSSKITPNDRQDTLKVFHPARIDYSGEPWTRKTAGCKGNDLLFHGFSEAVKSGLNAKLIVIERNGSKDQELAKNLLTSLDISDYVEWLQPKDSDGYTWHKMAKLYRLADVVVSDFSGWPSLINVEGAASAKPVISHLETHGMNVVYPCGHPFVEARTVDDVCKVLVMLDDNQQRQEIGIRSRQWALENHNSSVVARRCENMLQLLD